MDNFSLYFHGGSGNRGCEAIVRSTCAMLKNRYRGATTCLYSFEAKQDIEAQLDNVDSITDVSYDEGDLVRPVSGIDRLRIKLYCRTSQHRADEYYYSLFYKGLPLEQDGLFLSVGGDNYCYGENSNMNAFNKLLKRLGKKTVLWGCSLDENVFTDYNVEDMKTYDAIFARETSTFALLKNHGFGDKSFLYPDPAFTLATETLPLPEKLLGREMIGINASPLIFHYESNGNKGIGIRAYEKLIEYIIGETDYDVLLIPHVFWDSSCDLEPLSELYKKYEKTGRVVFINEKLSSTQLKGYIARCKAFVGARTHSTIAAYSSCVPTLVLGYSLKSLGIAKDIFGHSEGLVLPIKELDDDLSLVRHFRDILDNYDMYRDHLQNMMPDYIDKARMAADELAMQNLV